MDKLVSIIVPAYNESSRIAECLNTVCNQTYKNIEIICVNDGSTDNTLEIMRQYAEKDPRIVIIDQKNQGLGLSRNNAIRICKGEYVTGMDADDAYKPDAIEKAVACMHDDVDLVCFNTILTSENNSKDFIENKQKYYNVRYKGKLPATFSHIMYNSVNFWNKLWRTSLIKDHGVRCGSYLYEDNLFYFSGAIHARNIYFLDEPLYIHALRGGSIMDNTYKKCDLRPLEALMSVEEYYEYLVRNNLLEKWSSILLAYFMIAFNNASNWAPESWRSRVGSIGAYLAKKMKLDRLYPNDPALVKIMQDYYSVSTPDHTPTSDCIAHVSSDDFTKIKNNVSHLISAVQLATVVPSLLKRYEILKIKRIFSFGKKRARYDAESRECIRIVRNYRRIVRELCNKYNV